MTVIIIVIIVIVVSYQVLKWIMRKQPVEDKMEYLEKMRAGIINKLMNEIITIEMMSSNKSVDELETAIKIHIQDFRRNAKTNTHKMELVKTTPREVLLSVIDSACDYVYDAYFEEHLL